MDTETKKSMHFCKEDMFEFLSGYLEAVICLLEIRLSDLYILITFKNLRQHGMKLMTKTHILSLRILLKATIVSMVIVVKLNGYVFLSNMCF